MKHRARTLVALALAGTTLLVTACLPAPPPWTSDSPSGALDVVTRNGNTITAAGWAGDRNTSRPIQVVFTISGKAVNGPTTANGVRTDVNRVTGRAGNFGYTRTLTANTDLAVTVCAFAINVGPGENTVLGCKSAANRRGPAPTTTSTTSTTTTSTTTTTTVPEPTIELVTPARGPFGGGTEVMITGTNLADTEAVLFGTAAAPSFEIQDANTLIATTPEGDPGFVTVSVITPGGSANATAPFEYGIPPTSYGLEYRSGPGTGPASNFFVGSNLRTTTSVTIGDEAVPFFAVNNNMVDFLMPALAVGTYTVTLTTHFGSISDTYTVVPA